MAAQNLVGRALDELYAGLPTERLHRLTSSQLDEGRITPVLHYIESHLALPLDNAVLARIAHQSKSRFIREFGRVVGQTPACYVIERRIAAAAEQLAFTGESIERIATGGRIRQSVLFHASLCKADGHLSRQVPTDAAGG